jgi:hypothetical protein
VQHLERGEVEKRLSRSTRSSDGTPSSEGGSVTDGERSPSFPGRPSRPAGWGRVRARRGMHAPGQRCCSLTAGPSVRDIVLPPRITAPAVFANSISGKLLHDSSFPGFHRAHPGPPPAFLLWTRRTRRPCSRRHGVPIFGHTRPSSPDPPRRGRRAGGRRRASVGRVCRCAMQPIRGSCRHGHLGRLLEPCSAQNIRRSRLIREYGRRPSCPRPEPIAEEVTRPGAASTSSSSSPAPG